MDINTQKEVSFEVLKTLKMIDDSALVAGGAPRNWEEGKLAKDIDLYLRWNVEGQGRMVQYLHELISPDIKMESNVDCTYHFGSDQFCMGKLLSFRYKGVLFQLIIIKEIEVLPDFRKAILDHMDVGINRISWEPFYKSEVLGGGFKYTEEYREDFDNKTLTLYSGCMNPEQLAHCLTKHLPKMQSYYPDYPLLISTR